LVLLYSVGVVFGTTERVLFMTGWGTGELFLFIAFCANGTAAFGLWGQQVASLVPVFEQQDFQLLLPHDADRVAA